MTFKSSYRKRSAYLLLGALLFMIIVYNLALKKTISLVNQQKLITQQIQTANEAPQIMNQLHKKLRNLDKKIGTSPIEHGNIHELILERTNKYIKNNPIIIREFPQENMYNENGYLLRTNIVVLEGGFINLLKYLHYLENDNQIGKIVSSNFFTQKDNATGSRVLYLRIFIQNIINTQNGY